MLAPTEELEAFTVSEGTGTRDDPYRGTITYNDEELMDDLDGKYVEVGTVFVCIFSMPVMSKCDYLISEGFGLSVSVNGLEGTVSKSGDITVLTKEWGSDVAEPFFTFHAVSPYDDLAFLSDPSDGILIPPNHHLVTFIQTDGTCEYRVVEHGGHIKDVTAILGNDKCWYDGQIQYNTDMLNGLNITGDITFTAVTHSGSGGVIG